MAGIPSGDLGRRAGAVGPRRLGREENLETGKGPALGRGDRRGHHPKGEDTAVGCADFTDDVRSVGLGAADPGRQPHRLADMDARRRTEQVHLKGGQFLLLRGEPVEQAVPEPLVQVFLSGRQGPAPKRIGQDGQRLALPITLDRQQRLRRRLYRRQHGGASAGDRAGKHAENGGPCVGAAGKYGMGQP